MRAFITTLAALFAAAPALAATERHSYTPFDEDGAPRISVADYRHADSCTGSFLSSLDGPLRCFSGSFIHDPCFPDPTGADRALCASSPRARSGIMLRGAPGALQGVAEGGHIPWAIELFDGSLCTAVPGATAARGSRRANYSCGREGPILWGSPNRSRATWTIYRSATWTGRLKRVKISVAWR